jgi:hypothetical protein
VEKLRGWLFRWRYLVIGVQAAVAGVFFYSAVSIARQPRALGALTADIPAPRLPAPAASIAVAVAGGPVGGTATTRARTLLPSASLLDRMNQDDFALYRQQSSLIELAIRAARAYIEGRVIPALDAADQKGRNR